MPQMKQHCGHEHRNWNEHSSIPFVDAHDATQQREDDKWIIFKETMY